jgi:predicted HTH transcriptional regulator
MNAAEVIERISRCEDSQTRFLPNLANEASFAQELIALANGRGGQVFLGVDSNGKVLGLSAEDHVREWRAAKIFAEKHMYPAIAIETENAEVNGRRVTVVSIREGGAKPYSDSDGNFWVKCAASTRLVTSRTEVDRLLRPAACVHADEVPVEGTTCGDIDLEHFSEFFEKLYGEPLDKALDRDGLSLGRLLNNLGLAQEATLNLAGLMIFGRQPQRHRPAFVVKAVSFVGNNPAGDKYRDSQDIKGCLRDLHKGTMSFLTRNLRRLQGEKGFNTEGDLEVPPAALEELVVNMLLHRDYFISAAWRAMLFDDRIELISPGALPNNLTIENIRNGVSVIRNPLIASFATKGGELPYRGIGTGIRRALAAVPDLELESDHECNLFTARIPRKAT